MTLQTELATSQLIARLRQERDEARRLMKIARNEHDRIRACTNGLMGAAQWLVDGLEGRRTGEEWDVDAAEISTKQALGAFK